MAEIRILPRRALISVSDKTGLTELAGALAAAGVEILSTGGTAQALRAAGLAVIDVSDWTGFPEMLDGRVKTLHPKVHGGILYRRDLPGHVQAAEQAGIGAIDLVVVNLYPFEATVARPGVSAEDAIENIDIGGPALIRAAAKNHDHVAVLTDPRDYAELRQALADGGTTQAQRYRLAARAYAHTARYDGAIAAWMTGRDQTLPDVFTFQVSRHQDLRYGENPHQHAAFYRDLHVAPGLFASYRQIQGKELSYNNIADADAAWECVRAFADCACVIIKHANPCGVAQASSPEEAYGLAFATDPTSAFGGIIAFNRPVDAACARAVSGQFVEVLLAPAILPEAREILVAKPGVRVLEIPAGDGANALEFKRVGGGLLVQGPDLARTAAADLRVVTRRRPDAQQTEALLFAWRVAHYVKSNAIVFCAPGRTLGVGAGQMSRVDSTRIAVAKAASAGLDLTGSVVASDAFFPFRDGVDVLAESGAIAIIQPGGSVRDEEVIAAADEHGLAMVFTGVRHFRH